MTSYYDLLKVPRDASTETIKAAFRKLSLETHPDVARNADPEHFKLISHAASVLTNPSKRRMYDMQLQHGSSALYGIYRNQYTQHQQSPSHRYERGSAPSQTVPSFRSIPFRYIFMGSVAAYATISCLHWMYGKRQQDNRLTEAMSRDSQALIPAWKNPRTGYYEQPAPWDPVYRQLNPTIEMIPRDKVRMRKF